MATSENALSFHTAFDAQPGTPAEVAPDVLRVTAPNASPFTFTGTNTFLIGGSELFVMDPGPDDERHLKAIMSAIGGRPVSAILLTHTHRDHSALAAKLKQATGAPLWFGGPHRLSRPRRPLEINVLAGSCDWPLRPDRTLTHGERIVIGDIKIEVIATPGHCANHLAFGIEARDLLFSGDHVMGWNSTLVAVPDGSMTAYFSSLDRLIAAPYVRYLPAHGGPIEDGPRFARALKAHREVRNRQIIEAVVNGARTTGTIVSLLYPGVTAATRRAAAMTVEAHLEYLDARGELRLHHWPWGTRVSPAS